MQLAKWWGVHLVPGLRNAPTSSFFFVSTLMTGTLSAAQRSRSSVMCRNWSSRLGWEAPASFLWLTRSEQPIALSNRATVWGQTSMPSAHSWSATLAVVRRVHFRPLTGVAGRLVVHQGFDAGDDFRRFFFRRSPSAARAPHPVDLDVALDQLPPSGGDRRRVDAEQSGDAPVAAPPALERFEAGEQPPLPLVEQAGEQHDGGAQLLRHQVGVGQGPYESGRGHQQASRAHLVRLVRAVGHTVEELGGEFVPRQPPVAAELAQRVLGADTEQVVQFLDEVSGLGMVDERVGGCDQGAGAGEADPGERPQAALVEVGEFIEGVEAAAMRVAGAGVDVLELAERGAPAGAGAERRHHRVTARRWSACGAGR